MPATSTQRVQKAKAAKSVRRQKERNLLLPIPRVSAKRAHERSQKQKYSLMDRRQWWRQFPAVDMPMLPHPHAKVAEKDLPQAKVQAIEAMQEFGVLVECSRASGMGRGQLSYWVRKESTDAEFQLAMRQARRECQERLEGAFIQRGMTKGGDLAGIFYLKHNREKYREGPTKIELTGKDGTPLNALDAAKADLLARLGKLAGSGASGSRQGLEGKQELVVGGEPGRPRLVKGTEPEVTRAGPRRKG